MLNRKNCVPLRPFMRRLILFLSFLGALCAPLRLLADTTQAADELDSTLRVSLLTCSPGSATYELYGHTAIRARSERDRFFTKDRLSALAARIAVMTAGICIIVK